MYLKFYGSGRGSTPVILHWIWMVFVFSFPGALEANANIGHYNDVQSPANFKRETAGREGGMDTNLTIIKTRLYNKYLKGNSAGTEPVARMLKSLQSNGSWKAYDYFERPKLGLKAIGHLQRLVSMCVAYRSRDSSLFNNAALKTSIHSALNYWYETDPESDHHWFNEIGVPRELAKILTLMGKELSSDELTRGIRNLKKANVNGVFKYGSNKATGQNMIWIARIQMEAGCLEKSPDYVGFSMKEIEKEIVVTDKEGIQADWSFHQHGAQLYSGGYGINFSADCAEIAALVNSTAYQLGKEQTDILSHYILDGQQWMIRGDMMDYGTMGREIARINKNANPVALASDNMAELHTPGRDAFVALSARIKGLLPIDQGPTGNRHFWRSDFMVHQRPSFYASVKMYSERVIGSESGNGEANFNYHLPDGSNLLIKTGNEYRNIFPLWDWKKIPGVTNRQSPAPLPLINFGKNFFGKTSFVGGVSDGVYGMSCLDLDKDSLTARKAWFFFDKDYVCMGASISSATIDNITTTINQCYAQSPVTVSSGNSVSKQVANKAFSLQDTGWVYHAGAAYLFPGKTNVKLKVDMRTASWQTINTFNTDKRSEQGNVFTLWIDHGFKPVNSSYTYIVIPQIELEKVQEHISRKNISILSNTSRIQAVKNISLGLTQIAFYEAGRVELDADTYVETDQPCLLMFHEGQSSTSITVSNPENKALAVKVKVLNKRNKTGTLHNKDAYALEVDFDLPGGVYAGQSITKLLPQR